MRSSGGRLPFLNCQVPATIRLCLLVAPFGLLGGTLTALLPGGWQITVISTLTFAFLPIVLGLAKRRFDLFEPIWMFSLFYVIAYGFKGALILTDPQSFVTFPSLYPVNPDLRPIFVLGFVGLGAFYLGYFLPVHRFVAKVIPDFSTVSSRRRRNASLIGLVFSMAATYLLLGTVGASFSFGSLFSGETRRYLLEGTFARGPIFAFVPMMPFFALAYVQHVLSRSNRTFMSWVGLAVVLAVSELSLALTGSRTLFVGILAGTVLLVHVQLRRIPASIQLLAVAAGLALGGTLGIFLVPDQYRLTAFDVFRRLMGTFDAFDLFVIAFENVKETFFWGLTLLEDVFITFIPRALWPSKPLIYGVVRLQEAILPGLLAERNAASYPVSLLGEGYLIFGLPGIAVAPFLVGAILRAIRERAAAAGGLNLVLLAFVVAKMIEVVRGFGGLISNLVFTLAAAWLFYEASLPAFKRAGSRRGTDR